MLTVGAFYGGLSTICCYKIILFEICVLVFRAFVLPVLDLITYFIKLGDPLEVYKLNEIILLIKRTTAEFIFVNLSIQHFIDGQGQVYQVPNYAKVIPRAFWDIVKICSDFCISPIEK